MPSADRRHVVRTQTHGGVQRSGGRRNGKHAVKHAWAPKPPPRSRAESDTPLPPPRHQPKPPPFRRPPLERSNSIANSRGTVKRKGKNQARKKPQPVAKPRRRGLFSWFTGPRKSDEDVWTAEKQAALLRIQAFALQRRARYDAAKLYVTKDMTVRHDSLVTTVGKDHSRLADVLQRLPYKRPELTSVEAQTQNKHRSGVRVLSAAFSYNILPVRSTQTVSNRNSTNTRMSDDQLALIHDRNEAIYNLKNHFICRSHLLPITVEQVLKEIHGLKYMKSFRLNQIYLARDAAALSLRDLRDLIREVSDRQKIFNTFQRVAEKSRMIKVEKIRISIIDNSWACKVCHRINGPHVRRSPVKNCRVCGHHRPHKKGDKAFKDIVSYCQMCGTSAWKKRDSCLVCENVDLQPMGKAWKSHVKHQTEADEVVQATLEKQRKRELKDENSEDLKSKAPCFMCGTTNKLKDFSCKTCNRELAIHEFLKPESKRETKRRSDWNWICKLCEYCNHPHVKRCGLCDRSKKEQSDLAEFMEASKSHMLEVHQDLLQTSSRELDKRSRWMAKRSVWHLLFELENSDSDDSDSHGRKRRGRSRRPRGDSASVSSAGSSHRGKRRNRHRRRASSSSSSSDESESSRRKSRGRHSRRYSSVSGTSSVRTKSKRRHRKRRDSSDSESSDSDSSSNPMSRKTKSKKDKRKSRKRRDSSSDSESSDSDSSSNPMFRKTKSKKDKRKSRKRRDSSSDSESSDSDSSSNPMFRKGKKDKRKSRSYSSDSSASNPMYRAAKGKKDKHRKRGTTSSSDSTTSSSRRHRSLDSKKHKKKNKTHRSASRHKRRNR